MFFFMSYIPIAAFMFVFDQQIFSFEKPIDSLIYGEKLLSILEFMFFLTDRS